MITRRSCSYCYKPLEKLLFCAKCAKHPYCSRECQKKDWKQHKLWCGSVCEIGVDFEVRKAGKGKGFGVFALRDLEVGEKVLAERCVLHTPQGVTGPTEFQLVSKQLKVLPSTVKDAIESLHPLPEDMSKESCIMESMLGRGCVNYRFNSFDLSPDGAGLCINASRFNHSCIPNCSRFFVSEQKLLIVSVDKSVQKGEELTLSYTKHHLKDGYETYQAHLQEGWGFTCSCPACSDPSLFNKLVKIEILYEKIMKYGCNSREDEAYATGKALISLYDDVGFGPNHRYGTYYEMFQMSVLRKKTMRRARICSEKCLENLILMIGGSVPQAHEITRARQWVTEPQSHRLYLALEGKK